MDGQNPQSFEPEKPEHKLKKGQRFTAEEAKAIGKLGGRPKKQPKSPVEVELEKLCKEYTEEAFGVWIEAMRGEDVPWPVKMRATENIVERGWGKAKETIEHKMSISDVFADVVREVNEQRRARLQGSSLELVAESVEVRDGSTGGDT